MINIDVETDTNADLSLLNPSDIFGISHGIIYRLHDNGKPTDVYFIGTGVNNRPICIWWDNEEGNWRLGSESQAELEAFAPHIKVRECRYAMLSVKLVVN